MKYAYSIMNWFLLHLIIHWPCRNCPHAKISHAEMATPNWPSLNCLFRRNDAKINSQNWIRGVRRGTCTKLACITSAEGLRYFWVKFGVIKKAQQRSRLVQSLLRRLPFTQTRWTATNDALMSTILKSATEKLPGGSCQVHETCRRSSMDSSSMVVNVYEKRCDEYNVYTVSDPSVKNDFKCSEDITFSASWHFGNHTKRRL